MCRLKKDGGNRCPVHRHDSMAVVKYTTEITNLSRSEAERLLVELRVEGRDREQVEDSDWKDYLSDLQKKSDSFSSNVISKNIEKTLKHHGAPDKGTFYALRHLPERARQQEEAAQSFFEHTARQHGSSPEDVRRSYLAHRDAVDTSRGSTAPPEYTRSNILKCRQAGLPTDKASVVAWAKTQSRPYDAAPRNDSANTVDATDLSPATAPVFGSTEKSENHDSSDTEEPSVSVEDGSTITTEDGSNTEDTSSDVDATSGRILSVSYQRTDGRMDVRMVGPNGTPITLSYRNVSEHLHAKFLYEEYDENFFRVNIMGNDHYRYDTREESDHDSGSAQCGSCGQFTAPTGHTCPPDRLKESVLDASITHPAVPAEQQEELARRLDPTLNTPATLKEAPVTDIAGERFASEELFLARVEDLAYSVEEDPYGYPADFVDKIRDAKWNDQLVVAGCRYEDGVERLDAHPGRNSDMEPSVVLNITQSNYRIDPETAVLTERRVYTPDTLHTDPANDAAILAARAKLENDPDAELANSKDYVKDDVIFDGSISSIRHVIFPGEDDLTNGLQSNKTVYGPVEVHYPTFISTTYDDTGHELPVGISAKATGVVAVRRNASTGLVEMDSRTTLRCSCDVYARNYDCAHVRHASAHLPNIAEQAQKRDLKHPELTPEFSAKRYVRVDVDDNGNPVAVITVSLDQRSHADHTELANGTKTRVPESFFADPERPTVEEMSKQQEVLQAMWDMRSMTIPKDLPLARESSKIIPVQVPVKARFIENYESLTAPTYTVSGDVNFSAKNEDVDVVSHRLKCDCVDYANNYDCAHVRATVGQFGHFVDLQDPTRPLADKFISVNDILDANRHTREVYNRALGINAIMDRDNKTFAEAEEKYNRVLAAKLNAFQRAEMERHTEVNLRASKLAPKEMDKFQSHTVPLAKQYEEERQYEQTYQGYRDRLMQRWENVEPGYTDNPDKFYSDYREALNDGPVYAYENVFDGSCGPNPGDRRVGVELEFELDSSLDYDERQKVLQLIADDMHSGGLIPEPTQRKYHTSSENGYSTWNFEKDDTVDGEIISPPLDDSPKSWQELETVCNILKKHGAKPTMRCGSHVHVSTGSYGFSTAKHANLYRSVTKNEDLLYRMSTSPKTGIHRGTAHCTPNVVDSQGDISEDVANSHFLFNSRHGEAVNFDGSAADDLAESHTEFRTWDATLDPAVIQQQMKISVAMVDEAERRTILDGGSKKLTGDRTLMGQTREREQKVLQAAGRKSHDAATFMETNKEFAEFLDNNFRTHEQRKGVMALFAKTKWQRSHLVPEAVILTTENITGKKIHSS